MKCKCANCGTIIEIEMNRGGSCTKCMKVVIFSWSSGERWPAMHMIVPLQIVPDNYTQGDINESHPQED